MCLVSLVGPMGLLANYKQHKHDPYSFNTRPNKQLTQLSFRTIASVHIKQLTQLHATCPTCLWSQHYLCHSSYVSKIYKILKFTLCSERDSSPLKPQAPRVKTPRNKFLTKFCHFRWFLDLSDQNELYNTLSYPKIWDWTILEVLVAVVILCFVLSAQALPWL